ncbi:hypothetical protein [Novipirellula artificiosorum]|uniref:Uncharacterized protein n=1 Tax=Novipirellula artificiosorum TaxID=2528016 RepID=A0A5C6DNF2_9BACT|nr:hypothetical protein [Novipirellula artificiosorum]TWU37191.1 hypothetical protein Poly41_33180 [Novipirellula artificiosorum]
MMNLLTYTVQSVHGLQETFQVSANGTIETHQLCVDTPRHETPPVKLKSSRDALAKNKKPIQAR